jgi:polysaccharide biosynthesis protein PslH
MTAAKANIVIVMSRFPFPLDKGDKLRAYNQIKELSKHYSIHLICISDTKIKHEWITEIEKYVVTVYLFQISKLIFPLLIPFNIINNKPFQVTYFYRFLIKNKIKRLLKEIKPTYILSLLIRSSEYVKNYHDCPKGIDYMDCFNLNLKRRLSQNIGLKKLLIKKEYKRVLDYEQRMSWYFEDYYIISEEDKTHLSFDSKDVKVVTNGINNRFFQNDYAERIKKFDLVFCGNMAYEPNTLAALYLIDAVIPILEKKLKRKVTVLISGINPTNKLLNKESKEIRVTGYVRDILDSYKNASVFVAPMISGAGLQNKILEAMATGIPCVISEIANKSLQSKNSEHSFIANNSKSFAEHIFNLLNDQKLSITIGKNGQQYVKKHFSWLDSVNIIRTSINKHQL